MENKVYKARRSFFDVALFAEGAAAIIGLIVLIIGNKGSYKGIGLIILIVMLLAMIAQGVHIASYKVTVDDHHLQITHGILGKTTEEIDLSHIASVKIHQSLFGRIVGYGDVTLDIIGKSPVLLPTIQKADTLKKTLEEKMN